MRLALTLARAFDLEDDYCDFLKNASVAALEARRTLRFTYVRKHAVFRGEDCKGVSVAGWQRRVEPYAAELEVATEKLESIIGTQVVAAMLPAGADLSAAPWQRGDDDLSSPRFPHLSRKQLASSLSNMDLRVPLAQAAAAAHAVGHAQQLATAVQLQTKRLLCAARLSPPAQEPSWPAAVADPAAYIATVVAENTGRTVSLLDTLSPLDTLSSALGWMLSPLTTFGQSRERSHAVPSGPVTIGYSANSV